MQVDGPFEAQPSVINSPFEGLPVSLEGPNMAVVGVKKSSLPPEAISYYEVLYVPVPTLPSSQPHNRPVTPLGACKMPVVLSHEGKKLVWDCAVRADCLRVRVVWHVMTRCADGCCIGALRDPDAHGAHCVHCL
jgi:hypothetical protein